MQKWINGTLRSIRYLRVRPIAALLAAAIAECAVGAHAKPPYNTFGQAHADIYPKSINDSGVAVGYVQGFSDWQSFVRTPDGTMTVVGVPGSRYAKAQSINASGAITGYYGDENGAEHGFLRSPDGTLTSFDPTGLAGTEARSINESGAITGSAPGGHGFLRSPDGSFVLFDPPGSFGTNPTSINASGLIVGAYHDNTGNSHGFSRAPDGAFELFDIPGGKHVWPTSVNDTGMITGMYDPVSDVTATFVRTPDGAISVFGTQEAFRRTYALSINKHGTVVGHYYDTHQPYGFVRLSNGRLNLFQFKNKNTVAFAINSNNVILGRYGKVHGFVRARP